MKIFDFFKKEEKRGNTEFDRAVIAVVRIEARRDQAKEALETARKALKNAYAQKIADNDADEPPAAAVIEAQHRLDAIERLLQDAKTDAIGLIRKGQAGYRQRLETVKTEIAETRAAIDVRRIRALSEFCKRHGLTINWPTKHNAGEISIPTFSIDDQEIKAAADAVTAAKHQDPDADRLNQLAAELQKLNVLIISAPELALQSIVGQQQR